MTHLLRQFTYMRRYLVSILFAFTLVTQAFAAGTDIVADHLSRNAEGVLIAQGHVVIKRQDETLYADTVSYDVLHHRIEAVGHVKIVSPKGIIKATSANLQTDSQIGSINDAILTLPNGEHLKAKKLQRLDADTFDAESIRFSACPSDAEAWSLAANKAKLDRKNGTLTTRGTRFEVAGIPILYSPYWQMPTRRHSGFLIPMYSLGSRRGTEFALPYYFAPNPSWDATLTPFYMSKRGFMPELELRHASSLGTENLNGEFIHDRITGTRRGRYKANINWTLTPDTYFIVNADHVSDRNYLPDYNMSNLVTTRYTQSQAELAGISRFGDWLLLGRDQQDLTQPNDAATPQIAPRLESRLHVPLDRNLLVHFDQQTTRFDRQLGIRGWRMDLHPYLEIPWQLPGGGVEITAKGGSHLTHYWMQQAPTATEDTMQRVTREGSLEVRSIFEHISANKLWRHTIEPVLRYDYISAPGNQSYLPNFDSSFGQLTMSNLLSGNRFAGYDRIDRVNRVTALLQSQLMTRDSVSTIARQVLLVAIGTSYNIQRTTIDPTLKPLPTSHWSNILGSITISPLADLTLNGGGQFDTHDKYWSTAHATISWQSAGQELILGYVFTDARFATAIRMLSATSRIAVSSRWQLLANIAYDSLHRLTQQAEVGLRYQYPCWNLEVDGYRYNRPSGTTSGRDFGFRVLLGLKGVGSLGS